jgi:hypothetical protein
VKNSWLSHDFDGVAKNSPTAALLRLPPCFDVRKYASLIDNRAPCIWRFLLVISFDVQSLSLFGSVARGESRPDSDLDILVTYSQVPGLFKYLDLKEYLEKLFHQPVDLVTMKALKKQLRDEILGEAVHVH